MAWEQAARSSGLLAVTRPSRAWGCSRNALSSIVPPSDSPTPRSGREPAMARAFATTGSKSALQLAA